MEASFETTNWSVVLRATDRDGPQGRAALRSLCIRYWPPLYAFLRRRGHDVDKSQDLTQAFFTKLLEKNGLRHVRRDAGRFRTFLLTSLSHMLADERAARMALKRGAGRPTLPLDLETAERHYVQLSTRETPAQLFEKRWAITVVRHAMDRLEDEFAKKGRATHFSHLKGHLIDSSPTLPYAKTADVLGTNVAAVKMMVHRLRKRFGNALREEIARTVAHDADVDDELRHLLSVLRS